MTNALPTYRRSAQACQRCRQQKMRCSGGNDPPCERCAKAGHFCTFEPTTTAQPGSSTSNPSAQGKPSVAVSTKHVHPFSPLNSSSESAGVPRTYLPLQPESQPHKRRRVDNTLASPARQSCGSLLADDDTPYFAVQGLEDIHSRSSLSPLQPTQHPHTPQSELEMPDTSRASHRQQRSFQACLKEANIEAPDAEQMFMLFGERLAPFIPTLYDTDFSRMPSTPILVLAAIHSVARYFPDSFSLRSRTCYVLQQLLKDLLFQNPSQQTEEATETMQGLTILYACCEATSSIIPADGQREHLDMLTIRTITEGYAVKLRLGVVQKQNPIGTLSCLWWLWLYTMGHHSSILHGCPRTIGSSVAIQRAKQLVEQDISNARVTALLGEVELCQLRESVLSLPADHDEKIEQELEGWLCKWDGFLSKGLAAESRGLRFHFHFTRFHLHTRFVDFNSNTPRVTKGSLDAAQDFLQCTTHLPPMSKDRLRYLCDFGFVMMAYVCVFVIRAVKANVVPLHRVQDFHQDITDVGRLMQSFSAKNSTRPAIYGRALEELCAERFNGSQKVANSRASERPTTNESLPTSFPAIMAGQSMPTNQAIATSESMATSTGLALPLVNMSLDVSVQTGEGLNITPQDDYELANTIAELWGLDPYLSGYNDMIINVPPTEEYDTTM